MNYERRSNPLSICHHFIVPRSYKTYYIIKTSLKIAYSLNYSYLEIILDFKLPPCFECRMFAFGLFSGVTSYLLAYEDGTDKMFRNVGI
jgi:hypothetical protein